MPNYLTRNAAAEFLTSEGFPISPKTLAKFACVGGGPQFRKFGHRPLYAPTDLIAWAEERAGEPVSNTSQVA
tara:strand:- start:184407 stop:184622 length:216 start_codon:yes stop_codon:yes gene_type:complete